MKTSNLAATVRGVREFNRFIQKQIGVLDEHAVAKSRFRSPRPSVIYELAARKNATSN